MGTRTVLLLASSAILPSLLLAASLQGQGVSRVKRAFRQSADGSYQGWSAWSQCSTSCGLGTMSRTRGTEMDRKQCTKGPCVVWNDWNPWSSCSETCGAGVRQRTRFCPNYYGCASTPSAVVQEGRQEEPCLVAPCSSWRQWGGWGACSAFCDGGVKTRNRTCTNYGGCQGDASEQQDCNTHPCCTPWSDWGACSNTCDSGGDSGVERRTQRCIVTIPGTTQYASETRSEERPCEQVLPPCATWSEWQSWGSCSAACDQGERSRQRSCSVEGACVGGEAEEFSSCNEGPCAEWRSWARWSVCSASCGGGERTRQRICTQEGLCEGETSEAEECGKNACPEWTSWGPWGYCSEECGSGWQTRTRVCNQYNLCAGDKKEKRLCNSHQCPEPSPWGEWGECSEPCGGGFAVRTRTCERDEDFCGKAENADSASCFCESAMEDSQACNPHRCPDIGEWGEWSTCSADCDGGTRRRERTCRADAAFCVGANRDHASCQCAGELEEEGDCNIHVCSAWSSWQEWGECSIPCGGGARERKRECMVDEEFCTGNTDHVSCKCPGLDHSNEACNSQRCSRWARWGRWGDCSADCEGGTRSRTRRCRRDEEFCASADANDESCQCGPEEEASLEENCNSHNCAKWVKWNHWGECSSSCEGGVQKRERTCYKDFSYCFGSRLTRDPSCRCDGGGPSEEQDCNAGSCPVFSEWGDFGECSKSCEGGQMVRTRECQVDPDQCSGDNADSPACSCDHIGDANDAQVCNEWPCAVWASWTPWGACSRVCGGGSRTRTRQCPEENGCPGLGDETEFCAQLPCPDWGSWSPWSDCSVSCAGGQRSRIRTCPLEGGCSPGEPVELEQCGDGPCPMWAQWSDWGECTATCGEGIRVRTRECPTGDGGCLGKSDDEEVCLQSTCKRSTFWSEWSPCTQSCGGGIQTRSKLKNADGQGGLDQETDECNTNSCPLWSDWGSWGGCSATCGGGQRTRSRQCEDEFGVEVARGCVGKVQDIDPDPCSDTACLG